MRLPDSLAPYAPDERSPWDLRRVVHLHRRAGFAATWPELQRDLRGGPEKSINRILKGAEGPHTPNDFASTAGLLTESAVASGEVGRLKAAWLFRMVFGPDALGEKLTLLWHDHFATANSKVRDAGLMRRQNEVFRKHARGEFAELLAASIKEPALLLYLDAQANRKGHPNENLARELMELFTLGIGNYSEKDVKEAARALTGWVVEDGEFAFQGARHDDGPKTILGKARAWTGDDLVKMLLAHPATARRIALKLCRQFLGERGAPGACESLAALLRESGLDVGRAVAIILKSRAFFSAENIGSRVLSPVEFVVGSVRALGLFDPAPSTLALADWSARIGQDLFEPPNVGGWPSGRGWVHPRGLIARANFAAALLGGANHAGQRFSHAGLLSEFAGAVAAFFDDLKEAKLADRVALLAFSEFGRTIRENGSAGTDHGTAGAVFLAGPGVKGGLVGTMPSLTDLSGDEPKMTADFRRLYDSVLGDWLGLPGREALGGGFERLPLFRR
jgi:hypothetical protein